VTTPDRLGVAVVTYESADVLGAALAALDVALGATPPALLAFPARVVVVDNASRTPPAPGELRHAAVEVVANDENVGFARAANLALDRLADTDAVLFLNPDARLAPDALARLLGALAADPGVALAGPLLSEGVSERPFHSVAREARRQLLPRRTPPAGRRARTTGRARCLTGACLLARRDLLDAAGGLDTALPMYLEDVELCARAHADGRGVRLVTAARCAHDLGGSSGGLSFRRSLPLHLLLLAARVEFVRRRRGTPGAAAMRALMAAGAAARAGACALRGDREAAAFQRALLSWAVRSGAPPPWPPR
jgi:N-acetylglucosaminyl-diphospho-decaprenol L-rhamnosyltransferase